MIRYTLLSLRRSNFKPALRCWFSDLKGAKSIHMNSELSYFISVLGPQIPDDFYDPETEVDKEFLDIAAVVHTGGIGKIANSRVQESYLLRFSLIYSCRQILVGIQYTLQIGNKQPLLMVMARF